MCGCPRPRPRLCTPGYEDGHVTHLVVGVPDRRTVKVLLGVANGAVFVSPAWVTQSLAAGRWLPERDFRVPVGGEGWRLTGAGRWGTQVPGVGKSSEGCCGWVG